MDSKWSETCKIHETADAESFPVAGGGNRQSTNFPSKEC